MMDFYEKTIKPLPVEGRGSLEVAPCPHSGSEDRV